MGRVDPEWINVESFGASALPSDSQIACDEIQLGVCNGLSVIQLRFKPTEHSSNLKLVHPLAWPCHPPPEHKCNKKFHNKNKKNLVTEFGGTIFFHSQQSIENRKPAVISSTINHVFSWCHSCAAGITGLRTNKQFIYFYWKGIECSKRRKL